MKKEEISPLHDFLIAVFADRVGRSLAKKDVVRIGVIEEDTALGVVFSAAGFRKAKTALKRRKLPHGVRVEFEEEDRTMFLVPDVRLMLG